MQENTLSNPYIEYALKAKRNSVIITLKPDMKRVCGIKVLPAREICSDEEIFMGIIIKNQHRM